MRCDKACSINTADRASFLSGSENGEGRLTFFELCFGAVVSRVRTASWLSSGYPHQSG